MCLCLSGYMNVGNERWGWEERVLNEGQVLKIVVSVAAIISTFERK